MAFTCFSASDPAAVNATNLYDYNNDDENLWISRGRLPLCSSSLSPTEFLCLVCLQIMVYAVCSNLTNGVRIVMEGVGVPVKIVKSECPKLLSDDDTGQLSSAIDVPVLMLIIIIIIIIIIVGVVLYKLWRRHKAQQQRESELQINKQTEPLNQVQVQNGDGHVVQAD